ncbi:DUF4247 domain-containing protein [Effusibacillus pohliae]|uniref:DUF4247 domain-containing protein n=1 Tax=Effusibacillus pohliae TaxID=232270 RepID=UPI0003809540|nr:DUF4247 domain-containing protein [Effusibacillus pohliae]
MQRLAQSLKLLIAVALSVSLLTGCGSNPVGSLYPLESVTQKGAKTSRVYRAENMTVPEVAQELAEQRKPQEMSRQDPERMFLIYPDELYHLQRDPQKPGDTLIEVDSKEFVRNNYSPGFLEGYILGSILDDLFDSHKHHPGSYRGYTSRDIYKPNVPYHTPTPEEKKQFPPLTKPGTGSIIRRGDKPAASGGSDGPGTSVGAGSSITKKEPSSATKDPGPPPTTGGSGSIVKSGGSSGSVSADTGPKSGSSSFSPPKNNSPPKTRVGGSGSITRRK